MLTPPSTVFADTPLMMTFVSKMSTGESAKVLAWVLIRRAIFKREVDLERIAYLGRFKWAPGAGWSTLSTFPIDRERYGLSNRDQRE